MRYITIIIIILLGLGGVAFVTLLERKLLRLRQIRLGPNKVTFRGALQPLRDGIKLLFKSSRLPYIKQRILYSAFPVGLLAFFLIMWTIVIPWEVTFSSSSVLILLAILGIGTYLVIIAGWSPIRIFSKLGRLRSILQGLSFEVALVLVFLSICFSYISFSLYKQRFKIELSTIWVSLWVILILIDTNRAPFDLLEGERELIRGFNIEMRRLLFVFIFLREYGIILISSILGRLGYAINIIRTSLLLCIVFLIIRRCYPRIRYDLLSGIIWKRILTLGLIIFSIYLFVS